MSHDAAQLETKLAAARARLILDKPFLGALTLRLPMVVAKKDWCPTTATDARTFYYNPEYIGALSLAEAQFVLAHAALHCALSHFARRQHRIKHKWDLACDFAINPLLVDDGLKPPPNALLVAAYRGMTAEEIYPLIEDNDQSKTLDEHVYDSDGEGGGSGDQPAPPRQQQSRSERGTALSASSLIELTSGMIRMPMTMPAEATLKISTVFLPSSPCSRGVIKPSAKNPNTTVGMPARISRVGLRMPRALGLAYSLR